ncbi:pyruvate carboxylase [Novosphingobium sp. 9U]|uniref:pyruvate carboxylase n=1 Tax=Novosphingobium sp. 9U TaxID=2653158 RepID=UPI0012F05817|nr:pyruvate carboxylase [Novosphingobium sp. 9U]VWX47323.1 Pyruvate:Oxaloacetate transcarboxylase domain protein [Novosphingobium sp. 9U]
MAHINFLDETLRDGQQSLWGMRMQAGMALPVAPLIDKTGYQIISLAGSSLFEVLIRHCQEDPWAGLDMLVKAMPETPLRAGCRSNGSVTFGFTPDALMDIWVDRLCAHGMRSFWLYDVLFNIDKMHRLAKVAKGYGCQVAGTMLFTLSPVHDDAYYADKADKLSALDEVDSLLLYDTGGVLDRDRISTLVPAIKAKARGKPIEMHANNMLGQSAKSYIDAIEFGVTTIHTAVRPMANGPSIPSVEIMAKNVEMLGHTHNLDTSMFKPVADHFERVGKAAGFLVNQHFEYDVTSLKHQIPGGMMGTLRAQLVQQNMLDRLPDVLEEVARVRRELGYPGMATPFAQLVGTLAVLNIVTGQRYSVVPDEVIQYAAGFYGEPVAPIDADVMDRIMSKPRAKEILASPPEQPDRAELHRRHGTGGDDDELLLRALVPATDIDRMRLSGAPRPDYPTLSSPELDQVARLMKVASLPLVQVRSSQLELSMRR